MSEQKMNFKTDSDHPRHDDSPNGTAIYWDQSGDIDIDWNQSGDSEIVEVLIWRNYSPNEGEYDATLARFKANADDKTVSLVHVSIKHKYQPWTEFIHNPSRFVTDNMKRAVRRFLADETNKQYWRVKI
jgi:hypothetical protein